ncbi:MAG: hypothetical protein AAGE61_17235 [Pseudomonadota bacterium]
MSDMNIQRTGGGIPLTQTDGTQGTQDTPSTTGQGSVGQSGATPDTQKSQAASAGYVVIIASLAPFASKASGDALDAILGEALSKLKEVMGESDKERLVAVQEEKRGQLSEKTAKYEKAQDDLDKAEKKEEKKGFWNKLKLAFTWIGAIATTIVAAAMWAVPGAQGLAALLTVAAVVQITMAIDATVQEATGMGIAGNIAYASAIAKGKSEEEAKEAAGKADMAFQITMAVIGVVVGIAAFFVPGGQASTIATAAKLIGGGLGAVAGIGTGVTSIGSGVTGFQAAQARADASDRMAEAKEMEGEMQLIDDLIDEIFSQMSGRAKAFADMLGEVSVSMNDRGKTFASSRFSG